MRRSVTLLFVGACHNLYYGRLSHFCLWALVTFFCWWPLSKFLYICYVFIYFILQLSILCIFFKIFFTVSMFVMYYLCLRHVQSCCIHLLWFFLQCKIFLFLILQFYDPFNFFKLVIFFAQIIGFCFCARVILYNCISNCVSCCVSILSLQFYNNFFC